MIESLILSVVLFILASLCWGFVFSTDIVRAGRRTFIISILVSVIFLILASVFLLKGFTELGGDLDILLTSTVFALIFILGLSVGFVLSSNSKLAKIFDYLENMFRGGDKKENRGEIIDEILDRTSETGQIDVLERELIESVLKFNDKTVREVMVPRGDIVAIDIEEDRRHFLHKVIEEGYSPASCFSRFDG